MSIHGDMSVTQFIRETPRRIDGKAACGVIAAFFLIALLSPILDLQIGRLQRWGLSGSMIGLIVITLCEYIYLACLSSSSRVSEALNAAIIVAIPILFIYYV